MNSKIRLQSETLYKIEVNDNGKTIEFDMADPQFYENIQKMIDGQAKADKELSERTEHIENLSTEVAQGEVISEQAKAMVTSMKQYYQTSREAVDEFFGAGACDKIFGNSNYPLMFEQLFTAIQPEFEKAGVQFNKMVKKTRSKYVPKDHKKKVVL